MTVTEWRIMEEIYKFSDIVGQDNLKDYLQNTSKDDRPPHALILEGGRGTGKRTVARIFAAALLCEEGGDRPCMKCRSCILARTNNHPDIITVNHEKPNLISVDEVREQIIGDVLIKPFYNRKKIYIVPDAQKMNLNGQNAILKTIEEPPDYAVIILLTENREALLPTILSRCTSFSMNPLPDRVVSDHLVSRYGIDPDRAFISASLSRGSIGRALEMAQSEDFERIFNETLDFLKRADSSEFSYIFRCAREMASRKEELETVMDLILLWYRDMLICKASDNSLALTFTNETGYIVSKAKKYSYEEINGVFKALEKTGERLHYNANTEGTMDVLLLSAAGY